MDIKQLNTADSHDAGSEINIRDQFGKLTDCFITVVGMDSKIWRQIEADRNRRLVAKLIKPDDAAQESDSAETLAKATIAWRGFTDGESQYDFSQEKAVLLYRSAPYIADQVDRFIGKRANFIKG
jgi:hypothetical protein